LNQIPQITEPAAIQNAYGTLAKNERFYKETAKRLEAMGLDENRAMLDLASPLIGVFVIALGGFIARGKKIIVPIPG